MSQTETHHFSGGDSATAECHLSFPLHRQRNLRARTDFQRTRPDACEKLRFSQSASKPVYQPDVAPLISITTTDDKAGTITITDTGLGMTHGVELVENLGTIAHSGTKAFLASRSPRIKSRTWV